MNNQKMKKMRMLIVAAIFCLAPLPSAVASTYSFSPAPADMYDLDHYKYYEWGIDWEVPSGEVITGATLSFNDIYNYDNTDHILYAALLDNPAVGVSQGSDTIYPDTQFSNEFGSEPVQLFTWENSLYLNDGPQDVSFTFSSDMLTALGIYAADGVFGVGLDPDCHFFNNGVSLTVQTAPVPIPGAVVLLGTGLVSFFGLRRKTNV